MTDKEPQLYASQDRRRALELMQEYTAKLSEVTNDFNRRISAIIAFILMSSTALLIFVLIIAPLITSERFSQPTNLLIYPEFGITALVALGMTVGCALVWLRQSIRRSSYYSAHKIASILERLITSASQYREHSSARFGDSFEYDLRIVEAETALKLYDVTFRSGFARVFFGRVF